MARLHEVIEETLPDLVCLHVPAASSLWIVPKLPTTIRPHYSTGLGSRTKKSTNRRCAVDKAQPDCAPRVVPFKSPGRSLCHETSSGSPSCTGTVTEGATRAGSTW